MNRKPLRFWKYHALGNDYLVLDPADISKPWMDVLQQLSARTERVLSAEAVQRICNRHYGLGSDGILLGPLPVEDALDRNNKRMFGLRIFNPDGSEAEKSGNGLRIFARYLWDRKKIRDSYSFLVETLGGKVSCNIWEEGARISVEMGQVSFWSKDIPVAVNPPREMLNQEIKIAGKKYRFYALTIGNPHCVLPMDDISPELVRKIGPSIERHTIFPNRTNVQLLKILNRKNIEIEIWERGAGYTLASGSSSCAAAAVARKIGACSGAITVHMPGGRLDISFSPDSSVIMRGPVNFVGEYYLHYEAFNPRFS